MKPLLRTFLSPQLPEKVLEDRPVPGFLASLNTVSEESGSTQQVLGDGSVTASRLQDGTRCRANTGKALLPHW